MALTASPPLEALLDHSLITSSGAAGKLRFGMLDTIRSYASQRLAARGDGDVTRRRHLGHFLDLAEAAESALHGPEQLTWLETIDTERDNISAALCWAHDRRDGESGLRLASALWWYWTYHGNIRIGRWWFQHLLATRAPDPVRARALAVAGWLALHQGEMSAARPHFQQAITLSESCDAPWAAAFALTGLGSAGVWAGDTDRDRQHALLIDARERWRRLDDTAGLLFTDTSLAALALFDGDLPRARSLLLNCQTTATKTGAPYSIAHSTCMLGIVSRVTGDLNQADERFRLSLQHAHTVRDPFIMAYSLEGLAGISAAKGELEHAALMIGAAGALRPDLLSW